MSNQNLTPEEKNSIIEQKKKRLQSMGIPIPMTPIVPSGVSNVKDPNMLKRIQEIRNGKMKQEFRAFENKADGKPDFNEIPVPKPKNKPGTQPENKIKVPLEEFVAHRDPQIDNLEKMFDFDSSKPRTVSEMSNQFQSQTDDAGRSFIQNAKSKLQRIAQEKEQQFNSFSNSETNHTSNYLQSGMIILNEEDLKKKIIEIAKPIAKQVASEVIKEVLKEYAKKSNKSLVSEKKQDIQMLPSGKVIIAGKTFKLIADN